MLNIKKPTGNVDIMKENANDCVSMGEIHMSFLEKYISMISKKNIGEEEYQYEFCVESMNEETFEEYILRITGKKKIDDVADNIMRIRQICYAKLDRNF